MKKARFAVLIAALAGVGLFLAAAVRAEPPGGDGHVYVKFVV